MKIRLKELRLGANEDKLQTVYCECTESYDMLCEMFRVKDWSPYLYYPVSCDDIGIDVMLHIEDNGLCSDFLWHNTVPDDYISFVIWLKKQKKIPEKYRKEYYDEIPGLQYFRTTDILLFQLECVRRWENAKIDIKSKAPYPGNVLSNFYPNPFVLDGVKCASMEGFLQSLKTKNEEKQRTVCSLSGKEAKLFFHCKWENIRWRLTGKLYWKDEKIDRFGDEYQKLLNRAYDKLLNEGGIRSALVVTGNIPFTHSIGKHKKRQTVLTEDEFVSQLYRIRKSDRQSTRLIAPPRLPEENDETMFKK